MKKTIPLTAILLLTLLLSACQILGAKTKTSPRAQVAPTEPAPTEPAPAEPAPPAAPVAPPAGPAARAAAFAYDPRSGTVVAFGGIGACDPCGYTHLWDGADWQIQPQTYGPAARYGASMVYDAGRGVMLLFGGANAGQALSDTWAWDGQSWTELQSTSPPPARFDAPLVYDAERDQVVLYGGYGLQADGIEYIYFRDTWTWDGQNWSRRMVEGPSNGAIPGSSMAYITASPGRALLWHYTSTAWTWDGQAWANRPAQNELQHFQGQVGYDAARRQAVLLGKRVYGDVPETWVFEGQTWKQAGAHPHIDGVYADARMVYDAGRDRLLYITPALDPQGGFSLSIWAWDGSEWIDAGSQPDAGDQPPTPTFVPSPTP